MTDKRKNEETPSAKPGEETIQSMMAQMFEDCGCGCMDTTGPVQRTISQKEAECDCGCDEKVSAGTNHQVRA